MTVKDKHTPNVEVRYISKKNGNSQTRSGELKDSGEGYLLIDTGTTNRPRFDIEQDTKVLLEERTVKTITPDKPEELGEVSEVVIQYQAD